MLFQIPTYYAYTNNMYVVAASTCITSLLSINYWRNPVYSWRRTADMYWAQIVGSIYFVWGCKHGGGHLGVPLTIIMVWLYWQSCKLSKINPQEKWYIYHMLFHCSVTLNQCISIYYFLQKKLCDTGIEPVNG